MLNSLLEADHYFLIMFLASFTLELGINFKIKICINFERFWNCFFFSNTKFTHRERPRRYKRNNLNVHGA